MTWQKTKQFLCENKIKQIKINFFNSKSNDLIQIKFDQTKIWFAKWIKEIFFWKKFWFIFKQPKILYAIVNPFYIMTLNGITSQNNLKMIQCHENVGY